LQKFFRGRRERAAIASAPSGRLAQLVRAPALQLFRQRMQ